MRRAPAPPQTRKNQAVLLAQLLSTFDHWSSSLSSCKREQERCESWISRARRSAEPARQGSRAVALQGQASQAQDVMGVQAVLLEWLPVLYLSGLVRSCANAPPTLLIHLQPIRTHAQFGCKVERASNKLTSVAGGPAWQPTARQLPLTRPIACNNPQPAARNVPAAQLWPAYRPLCWTDC